MIVKNMLITPIVILVGLHVLNWKMKGYGWKGNRLQKLNQVLSMPWSLI